MSDSADVSLDAVALDSDDVVTVAELNAELAALVEDASHLDHDYVVGDVTDCGEANGHLHFDLVAGDASLHCVLFGFRRQRVHTTPAEDHRVAVQGEVSFYEPRGSCSILVTDVVAVGESEYQQLYEDARERLAADGLLAEDRKQSLPELPGTVGVVTSADSDAASDVLTAIRARHPDVDVVVHDASVQGEDALAELLEGVSALDRDQRIDVIVVTRGGGADKTLRVFNEPALCRVIATTDTPVCVGVGHEDDHTLADEVADLRVMTPTHAGAVVPEKGAYEEEFDAHANSLTTAYESTVDQRLAALERDLDRAYEDRVTSTLTRLERDLTAASETCLTTQVTDLEHRLSAAYTAVEQAKAHEAEKAAAVADARQEAASLSARRRRRYRLVIAVLVVVLLGLGAYILFGP